MNQAIHLFGKPLSFDRVDAIQRDRSEIPLIYEPPPCLSGRAGCIACFRIAYLLTSLPAFVVHDTWAAFSKHRCDVQEPQLNIPILPNDTAYGVEPVGCEGKLVTIGVDEEKSMNLYRPQKAITIIYFTRVYHAIRETRYIQQPRSILYGKWKCLNDFDNDKEINEPFFKSGNSSWP